MKYKERMTDVSNDLGYYLNQATWREKKLVGVLYPNGDKRCFLEDCHFNELNGKVLYEFEDEDSFNEWYDI